MSYDPDDGYAAQRRIAMRDCKHPEEFGLAGAAIAEALEAGLPIEATVCPGNGTRYALLFVPIEAQATYNTSGDGLESGGVDEGGVWIALLNGGSVYPLALIGRSEPPAANYLAEKWFPRHHQISDDVFVLERLLHEVGRRTAVRAV